MVKKVLVTGASGFLGSHICEAAHEAGYEVHALIRSTSSRKWLEHPWLNVHVSELRDRRSLYSVLKGMDGVVHAAAVLIGADEEEFHNVNVLGTKTLAEEAVRAGVKKFVFVSSNSADGPSLTPLPRTESEIDDPISPYGLSKKQAEEELARLHDKIHVVNLRYVLIYGPRDTHVLRLFKLSSGFLAPVLGSKPLYFSLIYVEDAARAAVAVLRAKVVSGSTYNIADGMYYTLDMIYDYCSYAMGRKLRLIRIPFWMGDLIGFFILLGERKKEQFAVTTGELKELRNRFRLVSIEKAKKELDWHPRVFFPQGIIDTIEWYKSQEWL